MTSEDYSEIPSAVCTKCGCDWIMIPTHFDLETYEVDVYGLEGCYCWSCKSPIIPPIPIESRLE
jgi:hypothetical protein